MAEFYPNVYRAGRLDTVPSAHSRSLASVRFLPQTRTPLRVGAKCGRPHRGSNRALTTGTSVWFQRFRPLGHGGDSAMATDEYIYHATQPTFRFFDYYFAKSIHLPFIFTRRTTLGHCTSFIFIEQGIKGNVPPPRFNTGYTNRRTSQWNSHNRQIKFKILPICVKNWLFSLFFSHTSQLR